MPARAASIVRVFYSTFSILLTLKRCIQIKKRVQIAFLDWSSQGRTDKESDCVGKGPNFIFLLAAAPRNTVTQQLLKRRCFPWTTK